MDGGGVPNAESRARADAAAARYRAGDAPLIVPCGWDYRSDTRLAIADSLRDYLIALGIPAAAIVPERRSRDTVGDAVYTRMAGACPRPLVVTSDYHASRAREIFSFVYGRDVDVLGVPVPAVPEADAAERGSLAAFRRTFEGIAAGDIAQIERRMLARHPFYNGEVDPRAGR